MRRLTAKQVGDFRKTVYRCYAESGRKNLPWRKTKDPYRILVSEFMLQQTQVPRVALKFEPFVERFPDFESLARARLRDVLAVWSGLGYNRRALMLKKTAEEVVSVYGGRLPRAFEKLLALPGVGLATAAGVSAFAFGAGRPFVETNIRTVFIHHFHKGRGAVADADILPLVEQTLDRDNPRRWFYALMDYGVALKARHVNPSRRSATYTRQGRFEGSNREARGLIIKALTGRSMNERELAGETGLVIERIRSILPALIREGFVATHRGKLSIA
jgi:A/G-specific adenine glycosylase